jgi:hypothetical protein
MERGRARPVAERLVAVIGKPRAPSLGPDPLEGCSRVGAAADPRLRGPFARGQKCPRRSVKTRTYPSNGIVWPLHLVDPERLGSSIGSDCRKRKKLSGSYLALTRLTA